MDFESLDAINVGDAKKTITNNRTKMQEKRNKKVVTSRFRVK